MSKTIDERVVEMRFDNKQFEKAVSATLGTLDKLKEKLKLGDAAKGLEGIDQAARKVDISQIGVAAEKVGLKFSSLYTIADQALRNITNSAVAAGKRIVSALTIDPIKMGFSEYELKMGSIQTIMAGTGESLETVNQYLNELNEYSDKTIYSFSDMTQNIGKFTNAGVKLPEAVAAIKGISNAAALSGANANEASRAMYNFSQALSAGYVKLIDWKSIENANMATVEFKTQLLESAVAAGKLTKTSDGMYKTMKGTVISATKNFNDSLQEQWMTSEVLIKTLGNYADETTDIGKRATEAATEIKTLSMLYDTLKEAAQSGWAQTWEIIFGDFEEGVKLWTKLGDIIGGVIGKSAEARNEMLENWKVLGGREDLIQSLWNAFDALRSIITPIKEAFREFFPPMTAEQLAGFTSGLRKLTERLKIGDKTAENLKRTFKGVFAVIRIIVDIISAAFSAATKLFGVVGDLAGGLLGITGAVGDVLSWLGKLIDTSNIFTYIFQGVVAVIKAAGTVISKFTSGIGDGLAWMFSGIGDSAERMGTSVSEAFDGLSNAIENSTLVDLMVGMWKLIAKVGGGIADFFGSIFGGLGNGLASLNVGGALTAVLDIINTILAGGLGVALIKLVWQFSDFIDQIEDLSLVERLNEMLDGLSGVLKGFQNKLNAEALFTLATAIAVLVASMLVLTLIDKQKLTDSLSAMTVLLIGLMGCIALLNKASGLTGSVSAAGTILGIAVAVLILATALIPIGKIDDDKLLKGIGVVTSLMLFMTGIIALLKLINEIGAGNDMAKGLTNVIGIAIAVRILASALVALSATDPKRMWGALAAVSALTTLVAAIIALLVYISSTLGTSGSSFIKMVAQMTAIVTAVKILSTVLVRLSKIEPGKLKTATIALGVMMVLFTAMLSLLDVTSQLNTTSDTLGTATTIVAISAALLVMTAALVILSKLDMLSLIKSLVTLGATLGVLAVGLKIIESSKQGAGALLIIAASLMILVPVLMLLGSMKLGSIAKSLMALGGSLTILTVAMNRMKYDAASAYALGVVAAALMLIVPQLVWLGTLSWNAILKGVVSLGSVMAILTIAMNSAAYTIGDAYAFAVIGASLLLLTASLMAFGLISWGSILKGIIAITALVAVLGVAAYIFKSNRLGFAIATLTANLLSFGAALIIIGAGLTLIGVGFSVFATAFATGITAIIAGLGLFIQGLVGILPILIDGITSIIIAITNIFIQAAPAVTEMCVSLVKMVVDVIVECAPIIASGLMVLLTEVLKSLATYLPQIVNFIFELLINIINGLAAKMPELIKAVVNLLEQLFKGVADALKGYSIGSLLKGVVAVGLLTLITVGLSKISLAMIGKAMLALVGVGLILVELTAILAAVGWIFSDPTCATLVGQGGTILSAIAGVFGKMLAVFFSAFEGVDIMSVITGIVALGAVILALKLVLPIMPAVLTELSTITSLFLPAIPGLLALGVFVAAVGAMVSLLSIGANGYYKEIAAGLILLAAMSATLAIVAPLAVAAMGALAPLGPLFVPALAGLGALAGIILALGLVVAAFGGLAKIPGINDFLQGGGKLIETIITTGIGSIIKGIAGIGVENIITALAVVALIIPLVSLLNVALPLMATVVTGLMGVIGAAITGLLTMLGTIPPLIPGALLGIAGIAALILEIGAIVTLFGKLAELPGLVGLIEKGGDLLLSIGNALGKFVGGVVGGIGEGISASLPQMATNLSTFMENLKPFIEGAKTITDEVTNGMKNIVEAVLLLTGANILDSIAGWFNTGSESTLVKFGKELELFGTHFAAFAKTVSGVDPLVVAASGYAAKSLASMYESLPRSSEFEDFFAGEQMTLTDFAKELKAFGPEFASYAASVANIDPKVVVASAVAAKSLAELANNLPTVGGVDGWWNGENVTLTEFATGLKAFGPEFAAYAASVANIDPNVVTSSATAAKSLAELAGNLPTVGGVAGWFSGENVTLSQFATELQKFAPIFAEYAKSMGDVDPNVVTKSANAAKALAELANSLPEEDGAIKKWFSSDKQSLSSFGSNLKSFGTAFKEYADSVGDISVDKVSNISDALTSLTKLANTDSSGLANFGVALRNLATTGIPAFINALDGYAESIKSAGKKVVTKFIEGIKDKTETLTKAVTALASSAATAIKTAEDETSAFFNAGKYVVSGFANGITKNTFEAEAAAIAMAEAALAAAKAALREKSPSRAMYEVGDYAGQGFVNALIDYGKTSYDAGSEMATCAKDGLSDAISKINGLINGDMEVQPTIRPVLDLSDVRAGAGYIGSLFRGQSVAVAANVGAISSSMNRSQNGGNDDIVSAINKLRKDISGMERPTNIINGVTYDDGSNIVDAVESIVRAAKVGRRV